MEAIEKRAREIYAAQFPGDEGWSTREWIMRGEFGDDETIRALIAALTPPEGYVLVPVEPTEEEVRATNEAQQEFFDDNVQSQFFSSGHYMEESIRHALRAVRAARPEVQNVND